MNIHETARRLLAENTTVFLDPEGDADMGYLVGEREYNLRIGSRLADSVGVYAIVRLWLDCIQYVTDDTNTLGSWTDPATGDLHLDVCTIFDDLHPAMNAARQRNELAIWDLENHTEIAVNRSAIIGFHR